MQHDIAGVIAFESFVGNGGASDIAAQAFEFLALIGATAHRRTQAEAVRIGALCWRGGFASTGDGLQAQHHPSGARPKKFYFDTITFDPEMLRQLIERFGPGHVLLGTDYPYDMGVEDPVGFINRVRGLSATKRNQIMGGNAAQLLGISTSGSSRGSARRSSAARRGGIT